MFVGCTTCTLNRPKFMGHKNFLNKNVLGVMQLIYCVIRIHHNLGFWVFNFCGDLIHLGLVLFSFGIEVDLPHENWGQFGFGRNTQWVFFCSGVSKNFKWLTWQKLKRNQKFMGLEIIIYDWFLRGWERLETSLWIYSN